MPKSVVTFISGLYFLLSLIRHKMLPLSYFMMAFIVSNAYAQQSPEALEKLLKPFQKINQIKLAYHEERSSLFLKKPKISKGYIEYSRPDRFIKTVEPSQSSVAHQTFIIEANKLSIERINTTTAEKTVKSLSLDEFPQFKQFKALFSGLLMGDASGLMQFYQYEIKAVDNERTELILKSHPNDAFIQEQQSISQKIIVLFDNETISSINMLGFGGERSVLFVDKVIQRAPSQ